MAGPDGTDVHEHALVVKEKLGGGGQGEVHELGGPEAGHAYKKYFVSGVNGAALTRLVSLPGRLTDSERKRLMRQTAWPMARVVGGGQVKGFIMRKVPPLFWADRSAGPALRELQYLLYRPKPLWGDIVPLDVDGRLGFVREAAALFFLLHSKNLVVGDISMKNLLWAPGDPPSVHLLDCDAMRLTGTRPVLPQPQTEDWDDPLQPTSGPDLDTDRYKLALLIARVLSMTSDLRPGQVLDLLPGLPERVVKNVSARFAEAGGPRGTRPDAAQWIRALDNRDAIDLPALPPVRTPPSLSKAPLETQRGPRPQIRLRPPPAST